MIGPPAPEIVHCPHCWAENPAIEQHCRACGKPLAIFIGPRKPIRKVGLGSLMLLIALTAVCLSAMRLSPGLGIFLLILLVPALARTVIAVSQRIDDDRPMKLGDKIAFYASSVGLMLVVTLTAGIAFVATCFPTGMVTMGAASQSGIYVAFGVGIAAALVVGGLLLRRFWHTTD